MLPLVRTTVTVATPVPSTTEKVLVRKLTVPAAKSSSMIVRTAVDSPSAEPATFVRLRFTVSLPSTSESGMIGMVKFFTVSPAAKVRVPLVYA